MRQTILVHALWLAFTVLPATAAEATPTASPARRVNLGTIKAACVIGEVSAVNQDNQEVVPLHNDDVLFQHQAIKTAANASIVLVFSNGATVRLGASAELIISEYLQDPFAETELAVAALKQEPAPSSTRLRLLRGELVGRVTKLHQDSVYNVELPCGVAGIRGTTFRHVYRPGLNGSGLFSAATAEGDVVFVGPDGKDVLVPADVEITGRVRARGGFASFDRRPISPRITTIIDHHARIMAVQAQRVVFRKAEVVRAAGPKPAVKRDRQAKRETVDDTKEIEREIQEREKARPAKAPKVPVPKKK